MKCSELYCSFVLRRECVPTAWGLIHLWIVSLVALLVEIIVHLYGIEFLTSCRCLPYTFLHATLSEKLRLSMELRVNLIGRLVMGLIGRRAHTC